MSKLKKFFSRKEKEKEEDNRKKIEEFIEKNHKRITIEHYHLFREEASKYLSCLIESKRYVESKVTKIFTLFSTISTALISFACSLLSSCGGQKNKIDETALLPVFLILTLALLFIVTSYRLFKAIGLKKFSLSGHEPVNLVSEDMINDPEPKKKKLEKFYITLLDSYQKRIDNNSNVHQEIDVRYNRILRNFFYFFVVFWFLSLFLIYLYLFRLHL